MIRRPADRQTFIHLLVSPLASTPHSSGGVKLSHRGFITSQSLIIHTQFKVNAGGISDDAGGKFLKMFLKTLFEVETEIVEISTIFHTITRYYQILGHLWH